MQSRTYINRNLSQAGMQPVLSILDKIHYTDPVNTLHQIHRICGVPYTHHPGIQTPGAPTQSRPGTRPTTEVSPCQGAPPLVVRSQGSPCSDSTHQTLSGPRFQNLPSEKKLPPRITWIKHPEESYNPWQRFDQTNAIHLRPYKLN